MGETPSTTEKRQADGPAAVASALRRRRIARGVFFSVAAVLAGTALLGKGRQWLGGGGDWARFDRRTFDVRDVPDGQTVAVVEPGGRVTHVRLAGVAAPSPSGVSPSSRPSGQGGVPHWSAESRRALVERVTGRQVLLRLPAQPTRDVDGTPVAYVYVVGGPAESVNQSLLDDGSAYADRRSPHPMRKLFEQAEGEARRKRRGLWQAVRDDEQPAWRQAWLRSLGGKDAVPTEGPVPGDYPGAGGERGP